MESIQEFCDVIKVPAINLLCSMSFASINVNATTFFCFTCYGQPCFFFVYIRIR